MSKKRDYLKYGDRAFQGSLYLILQGRSRTGNRGNPHADFYKGTDMPMGFGAYGRIMAPVTWVLDLILKLLSKLFKSGRMK